MAKWPIILGGYAPRSLVGCMQVHVRLTHDGKAIANLNAQAEQGRTEPGMVREASMDGGHDHTDHTYLLPPSYASIIFKNQARSQMYPECTAVVLFLFNTQPSALSRYLRWFDFFNRSWIRFMFSPSKGFTIRRMFRGEWKKSAKGNGQMKPPKMKLRWSQMKLPLKPTRSHPHGKLSTSMGLRELEWNLEFVTEVPTPHPFPHSCQGPCPTCNHWFANVVFEKLSGEKLPGDEEETDGALPPISRRNGGTIVDLNLPSLRWPPQDHTIAYFFRWLEKNLENLDTRPSLFRCLQLPCNRVYLHLWGIFCCLFC